MNCVLLDGFGGLTIAMHAKEKVRPGFANRCGHELSACLLEAIAMRALLAPCYKRFITSGRVRRDSNRYIYSNTCNGRSRASHPVAKFAGTCARQYQTARSGTCE